MTISMSKSPRDSYTKQDVLRDYAKQNGFEIRNRIAFPVMRVGFRWYRAIRMKVNHEGMNDRAYVTLEVCDAD